MNAAESFKPSQEIDGLPLLQRGRRMNAAESRNRLGGPRPRTEASTRPPHERGGKPAQRRPPRPTNLLQRGRRMNAAERHPRRPHKPLGTSSFNEAAA